MSVLRHIPLGERIPNRTHAVSASLPTMRAVIGYEEKDPEITRHLTSGYPRFVKHPFLRDAAASVLERLNLRGKRLWPTSSARAAAQLRDYLHPIPSEVVEHEGLSGLIIPDDEGAFAKAKVYLQHTGLLMSSREAEDYLVRVGARPGPEPEIAFDGYAAGRVKGALQRTLRTVASEDLFLANSGMNAVFAAFSAAEAFQRTRGRRIWIQLGWLYLDTIALLQKFTSDPSADYVFINDVFDQDALEELFARRGREIAGIITEVPTNPLIQTTDLPAVHALCQRHGAVLIADPTLASIGNIDVLPHCDLLVTSLTKFSAPDGDVLAGAVVVNASGPWARELAQRLPNHLEPLYSRNLERLAAQIGDFEPVLQQINHSTPHIVEFLLSHPKVDRVYWSLEPRSRQNYEQLARHGDAIGSMVTFTVRGDVTPVFDRLRLPKGPSFGMRNSLVCPFMYLAHYDLVTSAEGRAMLWRHGMNPQLLRLSVGCEPTDELVDALREALE